MYDDECAEHMYHSQSPTQANDIGYRDFIPGKRTNHLNSNFHNFDTFEEPWPIKKQRTDDTDPSVGVCTSASSPSTPAALGISDELGISEPVPTTAATRVGAEGNSLSGVYADIFKTDVDVWGNDPITTDSIGVDGTDGIEDDLNTDELFPF